jgi:hypothetical protein
VAALDVLLPFTVIVEVPDVRVGTTLILEVAFVTVARYVKVLEENVGVRVPEEMVRADKVFVVAAAARVIAIV